MKHQGTWNEWVLSFVFVIIYSEMRIDAKSICFEDAIIKRGFNESK